MKSVPSLIFLLYNTIVFFCINHNRQTDKQQFLGHDKYDGYPYRALMGHNPRWNFAGKLARKNQSNQNEKYTHKHTHIWTLAESHT